MTKEQVSDEKRRNGYTEKERKEIIKKRKKELEDRWDFFKPIPITYKVVEYK